MDPETIRMIVPAGAGIVGALLGSGVTGWINVKNAEAARESEREMWALRTTHERAEALRADKRELYVRFLTTLAENTSAIVLPTFDYSLIHDEQLLLENQKIMTAALTTLTLLPGTREATQALSDARIAQSHLLDVVDDWKTGSRQSREVIESANAELNQRLAEAVVVVRNDMALPVL
ncbi:hypothetical protein [Arthrobacter sp. B2a2-09]|uniref:hypothetical protein n=1 Tax=Arthrobacter sp. B2a2-09 TaxID=2952822 RepID=UPI0022CDAB46|nr:hypothetical protein [Arthrobacter sp. B2a2-09]MCZ9882022.1 hypothetical protein [Arthrobacter sp. B2a2-09]